MLLGMLHDNQGEYICRPDYFALLYIVGNASFMVWFGNTISLGMPVASSGLEVYVVGHTEIQCLGTEVYVGSCL